MRSETLPGISRFRATGLLAVGVVSIAVVALHGYGATLSRDAGVFVYGGSHVVDGDPPYVGIFNSVGPLADLVPALGIGLGRLVGLDDPVLAARLLFSALTATSCVLVSVLARDVFKSRAAGLVAPAVLLTFKAFVVLGAGGPREKTTMVVFLLAELILVVQRRWLAAGACAALATLTWQPVLLTACAAALVGVAASREGRLRAIGAFVLGGMIPSALTVAYFASQHALRVAFDGFLLINLEDTRQSSLIGSPGRIIPLLVDDYGWSLWLVVAGMVALTGLTVLALRSRPVDVDVLVVGAGGVAATAWTAWVINGPPDLFVVLPFAALGVAGTVAAVAVRVSPHRGWVLAGVVAAAATAAATVGAMSGGAGKGPGLDQQRANVAAVLAAAPEGRVVSFNAPQVLVLAGRTNPSPHQVFDRAKVRYLEHSYPGGIRGYAAWIDELHPDLIATRDRVLPAWAQPVLGTDYAYAGTGPGWSWFVARAAGPAVAAEVRAANRST